MKNESRPPSHTRINSKWIKDLNFRLETIKNHRKKHRRQNLGQYFIGYISSGRGNKRKKWTKLN